MGGECDGAHLQNVTSHSRTACESGGKSALGRHWWERDGKSGKNLLRGSSWAARFQLRRLLRCESPIINSSRSPISHWLHASALHCIINPPACLSASLPRLPTPIADRLDELTRASCLTYLLPYDTRRQHFGRHFLVRLLRSHPPLWSGVRAGVIAHYTNPLSQASPSSLQSSPFAAHASRKEAYLAVAAAAGRACCCEVAAPALAATPPRPSATRLHASPDTNNTSICCACDDDTIPPART